MDILQDILAIKGRLLHISCIHYHKQQSAWIYKTRKKKRQAKDDIAAHVTASPYLGVFCLLNHTQN